MPDGGTAPTQSPAPVRGVLFDVDDTLVDTAAAFSVALADAFGEMTDLSEEAHAQVLRVWRADAGGYYRRYVAGEVDIVTQRRARVREITDHLGLADLDDDGFAAWDDRWRATFAASWAVFDDAHACVAAAVEAGIAVGVVTNAPSEMQQAKIAAVGLADLLPTLVTVDTIGVGKPDPRVFHEGCRLIGTSPEETLYVGDELDTDAHGALEAGLRGVWLDRPGRRRGGPHVVSPERLAAAHEAGVEIITSLAELPALWSEHRRARH